MQGTITANGATHCARTDGDEPPCEVAFRKLCRGAEADVERGVDVRILSDCQCLCTTMYRIDQAHLAWCLDHLAVGKVVNRISVHPEAKRLAKLALERMLRLAPGKSAQPLAVD